MSSFGNFSSDKVKKKYGSLGPDLVVVTLERSHTGLGISLAGHKDRTKMAVFVCGLNPSGSASKTGSVLVGDELLEVNGVVLHGRCHLNASAIIKGLAGPVFKLILHRIRKVKMNQMKTTKKMKKKKKKEKKKKKNQMKKADKEKEGFRG
ncbi:hypothetical protein M8J77_006216 [Diaphorina citri]|nr:hypothetical protein M8J77_006216 [Diaphorina citri]